MFRISRLSDELYARGLSGGIGQVERRRAYRNTAARRYRDNTAKANGYNTYLDLLRSRKERNLSIDELERTTTATREQRMGLAAKSGANG